MESKSAEINTAPAGADKQQRRQRWLTLRKLAYPRINRVAVTSDAPSWLFNDTTVATGKKQGRSAVTPDSHTGKKGVYVYGQLHFYLCQLPAWQRLYLD